MKSIVLASIMFLAGGLVSIPRPASAQEETTSRISYKVSTGPVFPIEGQSNLVMGQLSLNDTTGVLEKISFEVPLYSFTGLNAGYLAWIGNSWTYPDMRFVSNTITQLGDEFTVKGNLEFRGRYAPVGINFTRTETEKTVIFSGDFYLATHDFFIISPPLDLVPGSIPMKVTLVFDKPLMETGS